MLPKCPAPLPPEISSAAEALAVAYANSPMRPRLSADVTAHWDALIEAWAEREDLPLLVRKQAADIGGLLRHRESGRLLAPCDNSPAHWVIVNAFAAGAAFTMRDVELALANHSIPVTMAMNLREIAAATMKGVLAKQPSAYKKGWKVDHLDDVGLGQKLRVEDIPLADLKGHFCRLMKPSNIVLVPSALKGLGDMPAFIAAIKRGDLSMHQSPAT
ncbi:MAG: hypothetical protein QOH88_1798 [Verrucomicrobiota bacterium]|jgi:hypothetical protein